MEETEKNLINDEREYEKFKLERLLKYKSIKTEEEFHITTSKELWEYDIEPEFFIANPLIPEQAITSITADSGKGKSLLALIMGYQIAKGEPLFGEYEVKKSKVLIIDQEMNKNEIATRFKKIVDEDVSNIDYIIDQEFKITDDNDFDKLESNIRMGGYDVIIFDTFTEIHSNEENDSGAMKEVNAKLLQLIRFTGVTIIYLHHHRKLQKGEVLNQSSSRGSTEIIAKVSSHLLLDSKTSLNEDEELVLDMTISQPKGRSSKKLIGKVGIKITNKEDKISWEFLGEVQEKTEKVREAKNKILEILKEVPGLTVKDVKEKTNIGENNLRLAFKELADEKILDSEMHGKARYYFPTTQV